jgi:outer membrane biogenesis lipoprotein LolB
VLPSDPGSPFPEYATVHDDVSMRCRGVRTLTAELSLSGRANGERLRGTLIAGFRKPDAMRLELRAGPLGTLIFVLAANADGATLLLPRDNQVARGPKAEDILGALTGITLSPDDLLAILTGCVVPEPQATGGRVHTNGWASIELGGRATLYLQRSGSRWRLRAARRGDWQVDYVDWPEGASFPARVEMVATTPVPVELRASLAQTESNVDLPDSAFTVRVPADAEEISLDDIRRAGPLRDQP